MNIKLFNDNILITELTDDIIVNGVVVMYDSDNPYMFCKVEAISEDVEAQYDCNLLDKILVIKRYAKEEYLPGYYFISNKDVRGYLDKEEYDKLVSR